MSSAHAMILLPSLLLFWPGPETATKSPTPEEINRAVQQLGDKNFEVREQASLWLWKAGRAAETALKKAAGSDDPEVRFRIRVILGKFKFGIYPDTPKEVVDLVNQFRSGDANVRRTVLQSLHAKGAIRTVFALVKTEPNENLRKQLAIRYLRDAAKVIPQLFNQGDFDTADELLELRALNSGGMRDYAVFLLLQDRLEAKISQLKPRAANQQDARLLCYLFQLKGDLKSAQAAAERASDSALLKETLFAAGSWTELARLQQQPNQKPGDNFFGLQIDPLGFAATYHRLAGDTGQFEKAVAAIKQRAEKNANQSWYCAEALLINERVEDAIELLKRRRKTAAFQVLARQLRFREALTFAGIEEISADDDSWMEPFVTAFKAAPGQAEKQTVDGVKVASVLFRVGEKDAAVRLLERLANAAKQDKFKRLLAICDVEYRLGLHDQAFKHGALALIWLPSDTVLPALFPKQVEAARFWWDYFSLKQPDELRQARLARVRDRLRPASATESSAEEFGKFLQAAQSMAEPLDAAKRVKWLSALAQVCSVQGHAKQAGKFLEQAAELAPTVDSFVRIADLCVKGKQWKQAAEWYGKAWEKDRKQPLPLYLQGHCLVQAGQLREGKKFTQQALMLPLGQSRTRYTLADGLRKRGHLDEAMRQCELIVRIGPSHDWAVINASKDLGNALFKRDKFKAADCWERVLLGALRTSTSFVEVEGYLQLPHIIHKARAWGLVQSGKVDEALREVQLSHSAFPGETKLALDLVPELEKAGRRDDADALFDKVFAVNERVCTDFPNSASYHNNLAWLAARCRRRPDAALQHSERAVKLAPDNPAYLDTLAEVHFQRGDRKQAVEIATKAVKLAPRNKHYRQQLERFRQSATKEPAK